MTNIVVHVATLTDGKEQINYDDPSVSMRQPWSILFKTVGAASLELWIILVTVVKHKVWIFELQSGQHVQMAGDDSEKINETKKKNSGITCWFWSELVPIGRTHGQEPIAQVQVEALLRCYATHHLNTTTELRVKLWRFQCCK